MKGDLERTLETADLEEKGRGDCKLPILLPHKSLTGMLFASFPLHSGHDAINQSLYPICLAAGEVPSITHILSPPTLPRQVQPSPSAENMLVRREEEGRKKKGKKHDVLFRVGWFSCWLAFFRSALLSCTSRPTSAAYPLPPPPPFSHLDSSVSFSRSTEGRPPEAPRLFSPPLSTPYPSICEAEAIPASHN